MSLLNFVIIFIFGTQLCPSKAVYFNFSFMNLLASKAVSHVVASCKNEKQTILKRRHFRYRKALGNVRNTHLDVQSEIRFTKKFDRFDNRWKDWGT